MNLTTKKDIISECREGMELHLPDDIRNLMRCRDSIWSNPHGGSHMGVYWQFVIIDLILLAVMLTGCWLLFDGTSSLWLRMSAMAFAVINLVTFILLRFISEGGVRLESVMAWAQMYLLLFLGEIPFLTFIASLGNGGLLETDTIVWLRMLVRPENLTLPASVALFTLVWYSFELHISSSHHRTH